MYTVTDHAGNVLVRFASIGNAREWAKRNKQCRLVNRSGKIIATYDDGSNPYRECASGHKKFRGGCTDCGADMMR